INGADTNTVGTPEAGNTIAFNAGAGVTVVGGSGNAIRGNAIFANCGLGIDLGDDGPTAFGVPMITSFRTGGTTRVAGTLRTTALTIFVIDVYANAALDPSGFGEGERYLGSFTIMTDGFGKASFDVTLEGMATAPGELLTTTATDLSGPFRSTSEFSAVS